MTSCMVFSWAAEYTALPQRLAGTASQYSKNAIPQLTMMTSGSGACLKFRWPYQAKVMNTLEANSMTKGNSCGAIVGISVLSNSGGGERREGSLLQCSSLGFDYNDRKTPSTR